MRYRGRRPWGRREVPGRPALGRGSPSTTGARMQVQLWHAAEAALSPTPGRKNMPCPGPGTSRTNRPGRGWAGSQPPFLGPQESGKEGRQRASGREDHLDPAPVSEEERRRRAGKPEAGTPKATQQVPSPPQSLPRSPSTPTLRSVLRIQMKVQTRGLLADLSTMKPPGPFSPLRREALVGDLEPGETPDPRSAPTHLGLGWKREGSCWSGQGLNGCPGRHRIQPPTPPAMGCSDPPPTACRVFAQPQGQGAYHLPALI